jgi:hypothetical protein
MRFHILGIGGMWVMARVLARRLLLWGSAGFVVGAGLLFFFRAEALWAPDSNPPSVLSSISNRAILLAGLFGLIVGGSKAALETAIDFDRLSGFFGGCERLYQWFWRSPSVRWTMIFVCACVGIVIGSPVSAWLLAGGLRPEILISDAAHPAPIALRWAVVSVIVSLPFLAAILRVSEDIDIKNGIAWPVHGKAWWAATGRFVRRAILLLPMAVVGALLGLEAFRWTALALVKAAPASQGWFDAFRESWSLTLLVVAFGGLGVTCVCQLAVKLMTRGGGGTARRFTLRTVVGLAQGLFYIALAIGLAAFEFSSYDGKPLTAGGLLGPIVDRDLWWISEGLFWGSLILVIGLLIIGLRHWYRVFAVTGPGTTDGVHGRSDLASEEEAAEAARGRRLSAGDGDLNLNY